ncbi:MAG: hypothetical protein WAV41_00900 [Microgenomates group bacterium]
MLGKFLSQNQTHLSAIDLGGVSQAVDITKKLVATPSLVKNTKIITVFGATEATPLRALAYPIPALKLATEIGAVNHQLLPQVEFIFMSEAGVLANGLDRSKVHQERDLLQKLIKGYVDEFHPLLSSHVNFSNDDSFTPQVIASSSFKNLTDVLQSSNAVNDLSRMGTSHGGTNNSLKYGVLHSYVHDLVLDDSNVDLLISLGAQPERHFYKTRQVLKPHLPSVDGFRPVKTIQYLSSFNVPPYQPLASGDPTLRQVINDFNNVDFDDLQTPVRQAINLLAKDTSGYSTLANFLKENQNI